ncbi:MAG: 2,3-bisphosphoglycerate-dependent phosphoglycerate mutase [Patescibacteria group bacterium]|nr:histidine phosphatase family protein [Candidatus Saccharibacteria bacterium]MDQ5963047.1 2,3-bisphosphoglycerate-dependent phosphoglycerate mutase [Patescibacteria group bacterium]
MKHVYFVRHGESEANALKRLGSRSATPLTALGHQQIEDGAVHAKNAGLKVDLMLVSPLKRAQQSGAILADILKPPKTELYEEITEQDLGPYENASYADYDNFLDFEESLQGKVGVETAEAMQLRAQATVEYLESRPEDTILLVSHSSFAPYLFAAVGSTLVHPEKPIINGQIVRMI